MKPHDSAVAREGLLQRLRDRSAAVGVFGLGYVGLPLALRFAEVGYAVSGVDIDASKVAMLNGGRSYFRHIPSERVERARALRFVATTDFARARDLDALIICVPTPLTRHREPDLSFVVGTIEALLPHVRAGQVLSLESTTYPGTTDEELVPRVEAGGLRVGRDVFVCFSPEREDPGNASFHTRTIPKI
jgi:UDP-N-acetyl-D-glucosamine dehydrogenase